MSSLFLALCLARMASAANKTYPAGQNNPYQTWQQQQQQQQQKQNSYGGAGGGGGMNVPEPRETPFDYTPPDASGLYHSDRYDPSPAYGGGPMRADMPPRPSTATVRTEGRPKPPSIEDARESLPSLVANFIARSGKDGVFPVRGAGLVRLNALDQNSTRSLGSGLFTAPAKVSDAAGAKIEAEVTVDLSGNEWKVLEISRPAAGAGRGAAQCFADAVKARVRAGSLGRTGFVFHDADIGRDWRLKLKRIHLERLQGFGAGRSYSCVDFKDLDKGRLVDLDFYVTRGTVGCKVDGIVVHRIGGKARTTKPLPAP